MRRSFGAIFSAALSTSRASAALPALTSADARRVATSVLRGLSDCTFAQAAAACGQRRWCS